MNYVRTIEWQDVKVCLPRSTKKVLIVEDDNEVEIGAYEAARGKWYAEDGGRRSKVTHWATKPKGPHSQ